MDEQGEPTGDVRASGRALIARLNDDESFREAFENDPEQTMAEAGIPRELMGDLVTAMVGTGDDAEVEGFVAFRPTGTVSPPQICNPSITPAVVARASGVFVCNAKTGACTLANWYR